MSAKRATYPMEVMTSCQYPTSPYIQNPGPSMYPSHPPTYDMAAPTSYPTPNSVMKTQNYYFPQQHGSWPYQHWGANVLPPMSPTYQGAPFPYYNPQYIPTTHHMTHPEMPQYTRPTPYLMTHPQSMPQAPQYFPSFYHMTCPHTIPQMPLYTPPYPHHMICPQTVTQRPQYFPFTPYHMTRPQTIPKTRDCSLESCSISEIKDRKYLKEGKSFMFKSEASQCNENSSGEASESNSSEDESSKGENNNMSQELNEENSHENVSDEASESNSLKNAKIEGENKNIPQEVKNTKGRNELNMKNCNISQELNEESSNENISDEASESSSIEDAKIDGEKKNIPQEMKDSKKGPNELNTKNCSSENHGTTYESPSESDCTKNKTSRKKKKKKQKNKSDVKDKGPPISSEASPVSDTSQNMKNKKEHLGLKDEKSLLAQFRAVITEVHSTTGKLQTQSGTEYYFPPALCFLYGVSLAHLELWHVLIEGQQVKVTLDLTIPEMAKVTQVTVEDENPEHDPDATVLDLQQWCSINSVPEKAKMTLIQQVRGLH